MRQLWGFARSMVNRDIDREGYSDVTSEVLGYILQCEPFNLKRQKDWLDRSFPSLAAVFNGAGFWRVHETTSGAQYPDLRVELEAADRNAFYAVAVVSRTLTEAGHRAEADEFSTLALEAGYYDETVRLARLLLEVNRD